MSNVVQLSIVATHAEGVEQVLDQSKPLKSVVVVGTTEDGKFYLATSHENAAESLWLLAMGQHKLLALTDQ